MSSTVGKRMIAKGRFLPTLALGIGGGGLAYWLHMPVLLNGFKRLSA
ncbi:hypothetical protein [Litchfieldella rifensis]|uniref:Uncharacterized protein n=1 Tax=Litchfieldella rifensis TaxID=762643 RepID=A0ABV7LR73_9GAMM